MIYAVCAIVILAAVPLAWLIKREAERSWQRHQEMVRRAEQREALRRMGKHLIDLRITLVDNLTPALQRLGVEMARMSEALQKSVDR